MSHQHEHVLNTLSKLCHFLRMDEMEDSGFDSDPKILSNETDAISLQSDSGQSPETSKMLTKPSDLQKKLEKQREAVARKSQSSSDMKKSNILSRTRLLVPTKPKSLTDVHSSSPDAQPLVMLDDSDESDDEFAMPKLSKQAQREITAQLIKDGYNLDLEPDDDELDLIPPRPVSERCACCPHAYVSLSRCCIQ